MEIEWLSSGLNRRGENFQVPAVTMPLSAQLEWSRASSPYAVENWAFRGIQIVEAKPVAGATQTDGVRPSSEANDCFLAAQN